MKVEIIKVKYGIQITSKRPLSNLVGSAQTFSVMIHLLKYFNIYFVYRATAEEHGTSHCL